jgi:hypothetical protein
MYALHNLQLQPHRSPRKRLPISATQPNAFRQEYHMKPCRAFFSALHPLSSSLPVLVTRCQLY